MQIVLDVTEDQAEELQTLVRERGYPTVHVELPNMLDAAIADAKSRVVSAAPRIGKRYVMNLEPGVIFGEGAEIGKKPGV